MNVLDCYSCWHLYYIWQTFLRTPGPPNRGLKEELTANAFEEDVQQCIEAGMDAHQSKPVDIDKLKETLCRLLAKQ